MAWCVCVLCVWCAVSDAASSSSLLRSIFFKTPQVEVTFEIYFKGILYVGAKDKGTGKREKITLTNDRGCLTESKVAVLMRTRVVGLTLG